MIAIDRAHLARPTVGNTKDAFAFGLGDFVTVTVQHHRLNTKERTGGGAGFEGRGTGKRGDHDAAGLGLPPGIDDRAFFLADNFVIPFPGFRVDGLTHRAKNAQDDRSAPSTCSLPAPISERMAVGAV